MTKRYRSWTPTQSYLLPPSPAEWLPEGHLAFFVPEVVDELDLGAIHTVGCGRHGAGISSSLRFRACAPICLAPLGLA